MGVSQNQGYPFGGPNDKDYSILGSILGSLILGNYHIPPPSVALDLCDLSRIERRVDIFVEEGTTPLVTPGLEVVVFYAENEGLLWELQQR